jgi:ABC-type uncharacterized transport system ATPase subunit
LYSAKQDKKQLSGTNDGVDSEEILNYLIRSGLVIYRFEVTTPSLNEIFVNVSNNKEEE